MKTKTAKSRPIIKIETTMTARIIKIIFRAKTTGLHHEIRELRDNWSYNWLTRSEQRFFNGVYNYFCGCHFVGMIRHVKKNINGAIQTGRYFHYNSPVLPYKKIHILITSFPRAVKLICMQCSLSACCMLFVIKKRL